MSGRGSFENLPRYVSWLGVAFGLEMLVEILVIATTPAPQSEAIIPGLVTSVPFVAGLIYGGYRLSESSIGVERYGRIGTWCLGGLVVFLSVNVLIMPALTIVSALQLAGWIRWASSIGASVGFLIGSFEARAIHREIVAERGRISHQRTEARRELVDYLDTLTEHEIEPRMDAIVDGLDDLVDDLEDGSAEEAAAIGRQASTLQSIIGHAGYLLDSNSDAPNLEPINLAAVLTDQVATLGPPLGATVACDVSEDEEWYVLADRMLPEAFEHLVAYLVGRDDRPDSRVSVTCEAAPDTMTVRLSCDGATVPDDQRAVFADYRGDADDVDASELAMVGMLIEYYGGSIDLLETGSGGTAFAVSLRRVPVEGDDQSSYAEHRRSASG